MIAILGPIAEAVIVGVDVEKVVLTVAIAVESPARTIAALADIADALAVAVGRIGLTGGAARVGG